MTTRSIVTSHPDVQCSVCGRRLLRGEQPDVFFAAGERRIVCELCSPRAAQEGWLRETQALPQEEHASDRPQRARSLWERLRQRRQSARPGSSSAPADGDLPPDERDELTAALPPGEPDFSALAAAPEVPEAPERPGTANGPAGLDAPHDLPTEPSEPDPARLFAVFNASGHAERVASIARLLGPPLVSVRPAPGRERSLWITIAWEICWHRYEVDPNDPEGPHRIAEGMELDELSPQDRTANALADEHGRLYPAPA